MSLQARIAGGLVVALIAAGCGGSSGHPDTGAGAHKTLPATENCVDLCQRFADCVVILCDEDTKSTRFQGVEPAFAADCQSTCTDAAVMSKLTPTNWTCLFESSCRQIFEYHVCDGDSWYRCT